MRTPMIDEHNLVLFSRSEGDAYQSSKAAELSLNVAILRAEIARSYEEFLDIFETFYADDVEVSREGLGEMIRGKEKVRAFLLNLLVPLHVMAEVAGLSVSVQQTAIPGDTGMRDAFRLEYRLHRRRSQTVHFEVALHAQMESVQGCIRAPLRSSADRRTPDHGRLEPG